MVLPLLMGTVFTGFVAGMEEQAHRHQPHVLPGGVGLAGTEGTNGANGLTISLPLVRYRNQKAS